MGSCSAADHQGDHSEYDAFLEKVQRTVYIDNLSPKADEHALKNVFNQFGNVIRVSFIANSCSFESAAGRGYSRCALVEMGSEREAMNSVEQTMGFPFMISVSPRPVRCAIANPNMFEEKPKKPGGGIDLSKMRWVHPGDPDFDVANQMKRRVQKHIVHEAALRKVQREEEAKLADIQRERLNDNYKKLRTIEENDRAIKKLADQYGIFLPGD